MRPDQRFEQSGNMSQKSNMHVIGKRTRPCKTMLISINLEAAFKHSNNFWEHVRSHMSTDDCRDGTKCKETLI